MKNSVAAADVLRAHKSCCDEWNGYEGVGAGCDMTAADSDAAAADTAAEVAVGAAVADLTGPRAHSCACGPVDHPSDRDRGSNLDPDLTDCSDQDHNYRWSQWCRYCCRRSHVK